MTVVLKQRKTNISHGDKTQLKSIIPSLSLPFCLPDYLSWSAPTVTFQFLHCQSLHLSMFLTLKASNSTADSSRSVLFTVKLRWIFHVSKGQARMHTHKLIWRNCIAWLQKELCLSADTKGIRLDLNGYGVFQGTSGSRGEQPLMISSWFCPRRAFWQTLGALLIDTPASQAFGYSWILGCHARILLMNFQTKPTHSTLKPLIFWCLIYILYCNSQVLKKIICWC